MPCGDNQLILFYLIMTVVSSKEFATRPARYYNLAVNEKVAIKRGKNMFHLTCKPIQIEATYLEQPILEPDENLRRAITFDELLEKTYEDIHQMFKK